MRPSGLILVLVTASVFLAAGCVRTAEFEEYKNQVEARFDNARVYDEALSCESRLDAYQDVTNSDEPIPTRRDEPIGTRRDECVTEFDDIFGALVTACRTKMKNCAAGAVNTNAECRACYNDCFTGGAWDDAACPPP